MKLVAPPEGSNGTDKLGSWNMINFTWGVAGKRVDTTIKMYHTGNIHDNGLQFIIFSQVRSKKKPI